MENVHTHFVFFLLGRFAFQLGGTRPEQADGQTESQES